MRMSVSVIVSAALLGSALVTAAAEFDNARTANAANEKGGHERIILAENFSTERLEPRMAPPRPSIRD